MSKACLPIAVSHSADAIQRIVPASLDATSMGELLEASRLSTVSALGPPPRQTVAQKPAPLHHHLGSV